MRSPNATTFMVSNMVECSATPAATPCVVSALWDDDSRAEIERAGVLTLHKVEISRHLTELTSLAVRALEHRNREDMPVARTHPVNDAATRDRPIHASLATGVVAHMAVESLEAGLLDRLTEFGETHRLTAREYAVLVGRVAGLSDEQLADCLSISTSTAATHRRNVARKAGVAWADLVLRFARDAYRRRA